MTEAITSSDDVVDLRKGDIITLKGRLDGMVHAERRNPGRGFIMLGFTDWTSAYIYLDDVAARSISMPTGDQVTVKAQVINHDQRLEAIAIWEPGGVPIPLVCQVT